MLQKHELCDRCRVLCLEKDNRPLGPLKGKYEYLRRNEGRYSDAAPAMARGGRLT